MAFSAYLYDVIKYPKTPKLGEIHILCITPYGERNITDKHRSESILPKTTLKMTKKTIFMCVYDVIVCKKNPKYCIFMCIAP